MDRMTTFTTTIPAATARPIVAEPTLTTREQQVLELLAHGATDHAIAQALFVAPKTVERYVATTYRALGYQPSPLVNRRVRAALWWHGTTGVAVAADRPAKVAPAES